MIYKFTLTTDCNFFCRHSRSYLKWCFKSTKWPSFVLLTWNRSLKTTKGCCFVFLTYSTDPVPIRKTGQITDGAYQEQTPIRKTGQITDGEPVISEQEIESSGIWKNFQANDHAPIITDPHWIFCGPWQKNRRLFIKVWYFYRWVPGF